MLRRIVCLSVLLSSTFPLASIAQDANCSTVADCAQKAMEAAYQAKLAAQLAVPKGAIMAFNLKECPEGWGDFPLVSGRFILGAGVGNRDQNDRHLTERSFSQTGGEENHALTVAELPAHSHQYTFTDHHNTPSSTDYSAHEFGNSNTWANTTSTGENKPHNNMPPFVVLKYCERK